MSSEPGKESAPVQLIAMVQGLLPKIATELARIKADVQHVVSCFDTHRRHTVRWRALKPAQQMLQSKELLPPDLWTSTVGGLFIDVLDISIQLDQDVHVLHRRLVHLKLQLEFINALPIPEEVKVGVADHLQKVEQFLASLAGDQLLTAYRAQAIEELAKLLVFNSAVHAQQDLLILALGGLFDRHETAAATDAGYHVVPDGSMGAGELIQRAEELRDEVAQVLIPKPPRAIGALERGVAATLTIKLNRALAFAHLALPAVAEKAALYSTVTKARLAAVTEAVAALQPTTEPGQPQTDDPGSLYAYRLKYAHQRHSQAFEKRRGQFERDEATSLRNIERLLQVVGDVAGHLTTLKSLHVYH